MGKKYINKLYNGHRVYRIVDPYNPLNLPPNTIRAKFKSEYTPTMGDTQTLVDSTNNVWDITLNASWYRLFRDCSDLLEVLGANSTNISNMNEMFINCTSLTTVALFDTSNVVYMLGMFHLCSSLTSVPLFNTSNVKFMSSMFEGCTSLTSVPLFDTSKVTNMNAMFASCYSLTHAPLFDTHNVTALSFMFQECSSITNVPLFDTTNALSMEYMFKSCINVQSGALALYQQASTQANVPSHSKTFYMCGSNTQTGSAELAQIPSDWK